MTNTISNLAVSVDIYETGGDIWTEGNTNFTYLIADRSAKKVYTNNSEYTDFTKLEENIEAFIEKLEQFYPSVKYVNKLITHSWGQKVIRFYDPDGNLIEVGTPM